MRQPFATDAWYKRMAKLEDGHDVSAGSGWLPCAEDQHVWKIRVYPTDSSKLEYVRECQECFLEVSAKGYL